jgi:hypothetical protein
VLINEETGVIASDPFAAPRYAGISAYGTEDPAGRTARAGEAMIALAYFTIRIVPEKDQRTR